MVFINLYVLVSNLQSKNNFSWQNPFTF